MKSDAEKNPAAVALGKLAAAKRKKLAGSAKAFGEEMGAKGAAGWASMSPAERSAELSRRRKLGIKKRKKLQPPDNTTQDSSRTTA